METTFRRYRLQFPATNTDTPTGANLTQITQIVLRAASYWRQVSLSASLHTVGGVYIRITPSTLAAPVATPYALVGFRQASVSGANDADAIEVPADIPWQPFGLAPGQELWASARGATPINGILILSVGVCAVPPPQRVGFPRGKR